MEQIFYFYAFVNYVTQKTLSSFNTKKLFIKKMKINYNNRKFRSLYNSDNGEVSTDMIFHYHQKEDVLTCTYQGTNIKSGHLIGLVDDNGCIQMSYHQLSSNYELMTGICTSTPEEITNGKIRLHESWQWTSGNQSKGTSILEEI